MTTAARPMTENLSDYCVELVDRAQTAAHALVKTSGRQRIDALNHVADALDANIQPIIDANARDLETAKSMGLTDAMLERLTLDEKRIHAMSRSVREIAQQVDPVGQVVEGYVRPNGIRLQKLRVPIGVVLFIYESRPNVTSDAAALCLKSGNAVILRGGKEAINSNTLVAGIVAEALEKAGLPRDAVQLVQTTDRAAVGELLRMEGRIDICIPRGGKGLIQAVMEQARIPVVKHYTGNCHVYVDENCDPTMAVDICINSKCQRPSVCNAAESLLFHKAHLESGLLKQTCDALLARGVEIRGDEQTCTVCAEAHAASEEDWYTEYNALIVTLGVVDDLDAAIEHINKYGSKHTDAIVTRDVAHSQRFVNEVDSADVFVNCSTRFSDGGEYGLGGEIGISTDKLHARGPMGAADLTTYKWIAMGDGQIRN